MKRITCLLLLCFLAVNLLSGAAYAKVRAGKPSFSRPAKQSTVKMLPTKKAPVKINTAKKKQTVNNNTAKNMTKKRNGWLGNLGLLAGGMFLGSLFANLLGGSPFLAGLLGMVFSGILLLIVLMVLFLIVRFLWWKITGKDRRDRWEYRR